MMDQANNQGKERLISLAMASELYGFNQNYLATLARSGRLKAIKPGSEWLTTPADIETYIRSRQKRAVYRDDIQVAEAD